jgi:hypothetical protein
VDTGYSCPETAVHPPAAVPLPRRGAPFGVDPGPGGPPGVSWPTANWPIPRLAPSMMTAPGNAPRAPPNGLPRTGEFPRPPLPAHLRRSPSRSPALDPNPGSHLPRPTGPPAHPLDPPSIPPPRRRPREPPSLAHGPRAHAHACPLWPSLRRPWSPPGRARMRWPRATVPVQQRRRRATAPAARAP